MKKMTMALAAATLTFTAMAAHAGQTPSTTGTFVTSEDTGAKFSLSSSYVVTSGTVTPNAVFQETLDIASKAARPIGYFKITGLSANRTYKLGQVVATGADSAGVDKVCFLANAGDNITTCSSDIIYLNDTTGTDEAFVQVDHKATAAGAGTTFITIPVTAYSA
ncbi:hypothetical protein R4O66_003338 [Salmonella enterica]|nr:hypothetical protein [Salmonella enterica]EKK6346056.1 hypothetical protein [Salmonella enterica]ELO7822737.1 hypothetical protein [Salmonella enterica]ELR6877484.1 hypothetical protein [Salmonella enterica]MJK44794.1 hypothetical protein [Salmonella enterica subsp. diarizonae]